MQVTLDYKKGDSVICLINGKVSREVLTGRATIAIDEDGSIVNAAYQIERMDEVYKSCHQSVSSEDIFRTREDALRALGFDEL